MSVRARIMLRRYIGVLLSIFFFFVLAGAVAAYILSEVRFRWPWEDVMQIEAAFEHAQAVTPGQGQEVTIAGVKVGEVGKVTLEDGHAVVRLDLEPDKANPIYRNASLLLRPRTLVQDQSLALDPGTPDPSLAGRGRLEEGDRLGRAATQPNVNTDELLAALDSDTRDYLRILLDAGGQGLRRRGADLRALLKVGEPTFAQTKRVMRGLAARRHALRRLVTNLRRLSEAAAEKDQELASLVDAASATFGAIGAREAELTTAVERLPGALSATRSAVRDGRGLLREAGPALEALRPAARRLEPALRGAQPLLRDATPIIRNELRPFVREAVPLVRELRPSLRDLNRATPNLVRVGGVLNYLANELGHNPAGSEEGYVFWLAWFAHNLASVASIEDAHGAALRGLANFNCSTLGTFAAGGLPISFVIPPGVCP